MSILCGGGGLYDLGYFLAHRRRERAALLAHEGETGAEDGIGREKAEGHGSYRRGNQHCQTQNILHRACLNLPGLGECLPACLRFVSW